jgi:hypothetical protein
MLQPGQDPDDMDDEAGAFEYNNLTTKEDDTEGTDMIVDTADA